MTQYTTTEVAEKFETDQKTLRKFLRADAKKQNGETPGKGARYAIEGKDLNSLKSRFSAWKKSIESGENRPTRKLKDEAIVDEVETIDLEELDEELEEPTDEDIAELDFED